jgi:2'-5' RNA ligase
VTEPAARRVFFALWPDDAAREALSAAAHDGVALCGGRRMRSDSLHMTLAFIGAVSAAQLDALCATAAGVRVAPFDAVFDHLGFWPHNRILWAGCSAPPSRQRRLSETLNDVLSAAGFSVERRAHFPHVTLLRNAACASVPALADPIRWPVAEFTLVESSLQSTGACYRVLARWPLIENA